MFLTETEMVTAREWDKSNKVECTTQKRIAITNVLGLVI